MVKKHLFRLAAPKTWLVPRKMIRFIVRPLPGKHPFDLGIPLSILLRKMLGLANTTKEIRYLLNNKVVLVDGRRVKDRHYQVGLMDVLSIPDIGKNYRILINRQNQIYVREIDEKEAKYKLCKIVGKTAIKGGQIQLNLHDAKNVITKEKFSVGDTVIFEFDKGITGRLELKEGNLAYLVSGKHVGSYGGIVRIVKTKRRKDEIIIKRDSTEIRTAKRYAFVVGDEKPRISLD